MLELGDLRDRHKGETVWVLGSGPSLNHIEPGFFSGKTVISTNFSADSIGVFPDYMFSHYHQHAFTLHTKSGVVVTLRKDTLSQQEWAWDYLENLVMVEQDSYAPPGSAWHPFDRNPPRDDSLAYGSSSLHGAMHLGAHLGADNIILVGADCGTIDDAHRVGTYPIDGHKPWALYEKHHRLMKSWLVEKYGVNVYSLNPFINFNLEGHRFAGV